MPDSRYLVRGLDALARAHQIGFNRHCFGAGRLGRLERYAHAPAGAAVLLCGLAVKFGL